MRSCKTPSLSDLDAQHVQSHNRKDIIKRVGVNNFAWFLPFFDGLSMIISGFQEINPHDAHFTNEWTQLLTVPDDRAPSRSLCR